MEQLQISSCCPVPSSYIRILVSAVTVTYQQSRLLSSSAAPIPTTPLVIHTMPASAKKQVAGIKITPSVCQLALLQHPLVHRLPFSLLTNQPAQQRTAQV